ncbi:MAG: MotA/TolQ/ExbB proton channel family protein [Phycisphaerae bacterium]
MTNFLLVLTAQAESAAPGGGEAGGAKIGSVWDIMTKGGPILIPIGVCSLFALAVFVERMMSLRTSRVIPKGFFTGLKSILKDGLYDRDEAIDYCRKNGSPIARIMLAGIKHLDAPIDRLEKQVEDAGKREILRLRKHLRSLSVIASITPLLGLLGTIFGLIDAFQTVSVSGEALGKTELLAEGIYQAMITTAAGLSVAIPVLIAFHWISARIDGLVLQMDLLTVEFIEAYVSHGAHGDRDDRMEQQDDSPAALESSAVA